MHSHANKQQRTRHYKRTPAEEAPLTDAPKPPRSRRQPLPGYQGQRSKRVVGKGGQIEGPDDCECTHYLYYITTALSTSASAWRWTENDRRSNHSIRPVFRSVSVRASLFSSHSKHCAGQSNLFAALGLFRIPWHVV